MNLDDLSAIQRLDPQNMLAEIENLPDQLARAWAPGQSLPLIDPTSVEALAGLKAALAVQK